MTKNELINAINMSKPTKNNKNNIFKPKRKEIKKNPMKPLKSNNKNNIFKSKRKEIKKSLIRLSKKKILKSIIKEIKEIFYDPILDRDEKIEEIEKILYDPKNNIFKPKRRLL